jgi:GT2 family glycosyltransferase
VRQPSVSKTLVGGIKARRELLRIKHILRNPANPRISYTNKQGLQLSVIIVNYNVKFFLEQCLCSVLKACKDLEAEIFVVDNNSTDGSREWLAPRFPSVKFKWNTTNNGFGKASNSVLKEAKGEHILFLNPDTIVAEDCFLQCLSFFGKYPRCGALGVRMIDGSGRFLKESKRSLPSAKFSFFKISGLARLFPTSKIFAGYYAGDLPATQDHPVDVLAGAFMMLSKKAIEATRGFDEAFFMYGEDVDLSYRVHLAGLENWYFAGTTIVHFKGESTQKLSPSYTKNFYGAMAYFVKKHYQDKKAQVFFLNAAIHSMQLLSGLKTKMKKAPASITKESQALNTAVVASQEVFDKVLQLIKYAAYPIVIYGRIALSPNDKNSCIGNIKNLADVLKNNKIRQIVFCEGEQSFKAIINEVERVPRGVLVLFHARNSASMVGSNNSNERGIFIAGPLPASP